MTTTPPGASSPRRARRPDPDAAAWRRRRRAGRTAPPAAGARASRPPSTRTCASSAKTPAAAARAASSSAVTNGTPGGSAETIHAAPTPQPVPISPTRSRPRDAASTCSRRPTSGDARAVEPQPRRASQRARTSGGRRSTPPCPRLARCSSHYRFRRILTRSGSARSGASTRRAREEPRPGRASMGSRRPRGRFRVGLVAVDVQNTFCTPGFELFVAGRSGHGALDDTPRLCEFVYRNLDAITQIVPTLDTHQAVQIFHPVFLVDEAAVTRSRTRWSRRTTSRPDAGG